MKRIVGGVLMAGGGFSLYLFAAHAMYHGRDSLSGTFDWTLPLQVLGRSYPQDVLLLLGGLWGLVLGFGLVFAGGAPAGVPRARGGSIARAMLLNALLLVSTLFVAYVGAKTKQDTTLIAVFGITALLQIALGFLLLILAVFERPKGVLSLLLGAAVYLFGVAVGVLAFLWGKPAP